MSKKPQTYYSSDWHFGHKAIINFERRQFATIQEHDTYLIREITKWSQRWAAGSILWFLGDFGDIEYLWVFDILRDAGIIINFVFGNHDRLDNLSKIQEHCDNVYLYPVFLSQKLVVSHFPVAVYEDSLNICGHLHGAKLQDKNHVVVSIHVANYDVISSKYLSTCFSKLPTFNRHFLYEPFAADYQFTQPKENVIMDKDGRIDLSASRVLMNLNFDHHSYKGGME